MGDGAQAAHPFLVRGRGPPSAGDQSIITGRKVAKPRDACEAGGTLPPCTPRTRCGSSEGGAGSRQGSATLERTLLSTETWKNNKKVINTSHLHKCKTLCTHTHTHTHTEGSPLRNAFQPRLQDADHLGPGRTLSFRGLLQAHMVGGTHGGLRAAVQGRSGGPMPQGPSQPTPPLPGLLRPGHPSGPPGCLVTMCSQLPPPLPASASLQTH